MEEYRSLVGLLIVFGFCWLIYSSDKPERNKENNKENNKD